MISKSETNISVLAQNLQLIQFYFFYYLIYVKSKSEQNYCTAQVFDVVLVMFAKSIITITNIHVFLFVIFI